MVTEKFETNTEIRMRYFSSEMRGKYLTNLTGWLPVCLLVSARHPGHLRSAGLSSLHQVPAGEPGGADGELTLQ